MYRKRQTFSNLNGSDFEEIGVGSSEVLAVKKVDPVLFGNTMQRMYILAL